MCKCFFIFKHQLPRDLTLPAFHAVTGCDTVSQFAGHGKVTVCKAFKQNNQLLTSLGCGYLTEESLSSVEKFVCKIYEPLSKITNIDQMRVFLFNKGKNTDSLPPTSEALKLHISQAHYQTTVWLNATVPSPKRMNPETCGWEPDPYCNQLTPNWTCPLGLYGVAAMHLQNLYYKKMQMWILHIYNITYFHRAAVDQLHVHVAIHWIRMVLHG